MPPAGAGAAGEGKSLRSGAEGVDAGAAWETGSGGLMPAFGGDCGDVGCTAGAGIRGAPGWGRPGASDRGAGGFCADT